MNLKTIILKRTIIIHLFLFFIIGSASSQEFQLKGIIIDANNKEAIPFATIIAYNNIELVDGTSADENGNFQLITNKTFTHFEIRFIGYKTLRLTFSEIENKKELVIVLHLSLIHI